MRIAVALQLGFCGLCLTLALVGEGMGVEIPDPPAVNCVWSRWSEWSPCDPCTKSRRRSRSVEVFSQFGGLSCEGSLGDREFCTTGAECELPPPPACSDSEFQCESGSCIKKRLMCNGDYDCEEGSDEDCDPQRKPCGLSVLENNEQGRTAGYGINILGVDPRMNPFNNDYFNGRCDRVRNPYTQKYDRLPWNVGVLNYETLVEETTSREIYEDTDSLLKEILTEMTNKLDVGLSFKFSPTEKSMSESVAPPSTSDAAAPSTSDAAAPSTSDAAAPSTSDAAAPSTSDAAAPSTSDAAAPSTSDAAAPSTSDAAAPSTSKVDLTLGLEIGFQKKTMIKELSEYTKIKNKSFMRVKGKVQLSTYRMRSRELKTADEFLAHVKSLPLQYERGIYFAFLEDYGTHYTKNGKTGGEYELVYVLNQDTIKTKNLTERTVQNCVKVGISADFQGIVDGNVKNDNCKDVTNKNQGDTAGKAVVDKVITSVKGGTLQSAVGMRAQLNKEGVMNINTYQEWARTIAEAPALLTSEPEPIYMLIPLDMADANTRISNLKRATADYTAEYNVCKCKPCQNGGTLALLDGRCKCMCPFQYEGLACQNYKADKVKHAGARPTVIQEGNWSCWSSWSSCGGGKRTRTRRCNTEGLLGAVCRGDTNNEEHC
ncbi:complement component C9 [Etheostoma spectabile]|uniref:complement component C9 n=1 Tax=Etheostoma spectabile TaxID=54343 RepID=UPI0013AE9CF3|nr:complement component C9 [Etheostoma spectabile]